MMSESVGSGVQRASDNHGFKLPVLINLQTVLLKDGWA